MAVITAPALWGTHDLVEGGIGEYELGSLSMYTRSVGSEFSLCYTSRGESPADAQNDTPDNLPWSRWALKSAANKVSILPVFPNLPVVVCPENPFRIVKGAKAKIYIRVPVWVRIEVLGTVRQPVTEIETVTLSKTWFGEFQEGELCYWISTSARREILRDAARPQYAICPMEITNRADEDLAVEKVCHRVDTLSIYMENGFLWGSETKIAFRGGNEVSQIRTVSGAPSDAKEGVLLSSARSSVRDSFRGRTFRTLQSLSDLGIQIIEQIV